MKYVYLSLLVLSGLVGVYIGAKFYPRPVVREVPVTKLQTVTQTKVIEKFPDGKTVERYTTQTIDKTKTSPQPKVPLYRAGLLMPVASELRLPTVTASRRLFGSVWAEAQFDLRHKEALLGVSIEF